MCVVAIKTKKTGWHFHVAGVDGVNNIFFIARANHHLLITLH
jgi:hypothetical protein